LLLVLAQYLPNLTLNGSGAELQGDLNPDLAFFWGVPLSVSRGLGHDRDLWEFLNFAEHSVAAI
jgi:hypothetical protein